MVLSADILFQTSTASLATATKLQQLTTSASAQAAPQFDQVLQSARQSQRRQASDDRDVSSADSLADDDDKDAKKAARNKHGKSRKAGSKREVASGGDADAGDIDPTADVATTFASEVEEGESTSSSTGDKPETKAAGDDSAASMTATPTPDAMAAAAALAAAQTAAPTPAATPAPRVAEPTADPAARASKAAVKHETSPASPTLPADAGPAPAPSKPAPTKGDAESKAATAATADPAAPSAKAKADDTFGEKPSSLAAATAPANPAAAKQTDKQSEKIADKAAHTQNGNADHGTGASSPPSSTASALSAPASAAAAQPSTMTTPPPARTKADAVAPASTSNGPLATGVGTAPGTSSETGATSATAAQESPVADTDPLFDQILLGLNSKLDARNGKAEIQLNPPNLGTLHVSINLANGSLTAQFQSSSDVVRDLLKSNMEKLKSTLESQGVAVDQLAVAAPTDKTASVVQNSPQANASANDGQSGGQFTQDGGNHRRPQREASTFSRVWRDATTDAAPIDVVA